MASSSRSTQTAVFRSLNSKLLIGSGLLLLIAFVAIFGSWLSPYAYDQMSVLQRMKPPSSAHWFGTDELGRDVFSRTLTGAGMSIAIGFGATMLSLLVGVPLGLLSGYKRGGFDEFVMRCMDVLLSMPPIMLGLLFLAVSEPSAWKAILAVGCVYIPPTVRLTRSIALELANEEFIEAARARSESTWYILIKEILPNAWPTIAVEGSLRVTFAILLGAALSFLGMGAQPPSSEWGLMISQARPYIAQAPWIALAPGLAMCLTVIAINLFGDGLRAAIDPRSASRGH
ncbi:peptide/nickel transport system permease protein [Mesorhizobium sp. J18]|nr:peptide/nickel transport system permease protein [Mesorhizobium sp. J18]